MRQNRKGIKTWLFSEFSMRQLLEGRRTLFVTKTQRWTHVWGPFHLTARRNGIHIMDLTQTCSNAGSQLCKLSVITVAKAQLLFSGTKRRLASADRRRRQRKLRTIYITHRWLGARLTQTARTVSKSIQAPEVHRTNSSERGFWRSDQERGRWHGA